MMLIGDCLHNYCNRGNVTLDTFTMVNLNLNLGELMFSNGYSSKAFGPPGSSSVTKHMSFVNIQRTHMYKLVPRTDSSPNVSSLCRCSRNSPKDVISTDRDKLNCTCFCFIDYTF